MATTTQSVPLQTSRPRTEGYPAGGVRFDWLFTLFCAWVVGGLYIDGWAHTHGFVDDTFFTPWHALLYAGVASVGIFLFIHQWRNMNKGYPLFRALPKGYLTSLIGSGLFIVGGGFDLIWHETFGFEVGLETLVSPAHLILATSGFLMLTGPLRAAWDRYAAGERPGWRGLGPTIINAALVLSVLTFFTEFISPFSQTYRVEDTFNVETATISDLYVMNPDGSGQTRLTSAAGVSYWGGIWSPDGTQILVSKYQPAHPESDGDLVLLGADGRELRQITSFEGGEYLPTWVQFGDGGRIAFINDNNGNRDIYWIEVAADGTFGEARQITATDADEYAPAWSPSGRELLYLANERIEIMNMDGTSSSEGITRTLVEAPNAMSASWSPDGTQIVYQALVNTTNDIFVINADGTNIRHLITSQDWDGMPAWSADGSQIFFKSWRTGFGDIYAFDTACLNAPETCESTIVNLTRSTVLDGFFVSTTPDGRILFSGQGYGSGSESSDPQSIIIAGVLIHSTMLMLIALMLVRRWRLPFGAMTVLFTLPVALLTVVIDNYAVSLIGLSAGLIADVLMLILRPSPERRIAWYVFGFVAPLVLFTIYFLGIQFFGAGVSWTVHLWLGAIAFAGIAGIFVAFGYLPPFGKPDYPIKAEA